jgi:hypothetical protein
LLRWATVADLVLDSVDFGVVEGFIRAEQWDQAADYRTEHDLDPGREYSRCFASPS